MKNFWLTLCNTSLAGDVRFLIMSCDMSNTREIAAVNVTGNRIINDAVFEVSNKNNRKIM